MSYAFKLLEIANDSTLTVLSLRLAFNHFVELRLEFEEYPNRSTIIYKYKEDDTQLELAQYKKIPLQGKNYIDVVCEDLADILKSSRFAENIKIRVDYFDSDYVDSEPLVNRVYELFRIHKTELFACTLHLQADNVSQLRFALKCFNPRKLLRLHISSLNRNTLNLEDIVKMDHWKNAKIIELFGFIVSIPFDNFCHLDFAFMKASRISTDDITTLVKNASNAPYLHTFIIYYVRLDEDVTESFLNNLIAEKQINQCGEEVRLIQNDLEFVHKSKGFKILTPSRQFSDGDKLWPVKRLMKEYFLSKMQPHIDSRTESSTSWLSCLRNPVIMEHIVQDLDFYELVVLRKVSYEIRQCIEYIKPDPKLVAIKIRAEIEVIYMEVFGRNNYKKIVYTPRPVVRNDEMCQQAQMLEADIRDFSNDFYTILENQTSVLEEFRVILKPFNGLPEFREIFNLLTLAPKISLNQFMIKLMEGIIKRGAFLPVEKFTIETYELKLMAQILQLSDSSSIKVIELRRSYKSGFILNGFMEQLASLAHWRNTEEFMINIFLPSSSIKTVIHFAKVDIRLESISMEDVLYLKEKFLLSSTFRQFKAEFTDTDIDESIFEVNFLGEPFRRIDDPSTNLPNVWRFRYPGCRENLQIRYYQNRKIFMFNRVSTQF